MKVVILAGGYGTRISEESDLKPKPMIEIGEKPILWHIMKYYSFYGYNDFVILLGYKGYQIKKYFSDYFLHNSDVTIDVKTNSYEIHNNTSENWKITLVDTGLDTLTGGRILKAKKYLENEAFMLTYGDGVSDVDISSLVDFHRSHGELVTVTAVQPEARFGSLNIVDGYVYNFMEKPKGDGAWINGGFFVCEPKIFDYLTEGDQTIFEREPLSNLAQDRKLFAYKHNGFWKPMDTLRDKRQLEDLWNLGSAPWKKW